MAAIEVIVGGTALTLQQTALVLKDRRLDMLQAFLAAGSCWLYSTFFPSGEIVVKACQWDKAISEQLKGVKELRDRARQGFYFY